VLLGSAFEPTTGRVARPDARVAQSHRRLYSTPDDDRQQDTVSAPWIVSHLTHFCASTRIELMLDD
jgi:hypothetical protein